MRILTLDNVQESPPEVEFAPSKFTPLIDCIVCALLGLAAVGMATGVIRHGEIPAWLFWGFAVYFSFIAAPSFIGFYQLVQTKPWLFRTRGSTLWIRCSTKPNALVLELDRSELAWAQPLKLTDVRKMQGRASQGGTTRTTTYNFYKYLDIGLTTGAAELLEQFVQDERIGKHVREQIAPPFTVLTAPARRVRAGVVRLSWAGISPGVGAAGKFLSSWTELRPLQHERLTND